MEQRPMSFINLPQQLLDYVVTRGIHDVLPAIGLGVVGYWFAAGVLIIVFRPFRVGDLVEVGGATGTVQDIQIFTTVLHTADNLRVVVPNDLITKGKITNYSANDIRRIDLTVGVAYTHGLEHVRQILTDILVKDPAYSPRQPQASWLQN
jgi:small conductance mechanosensitive channel